MKKAHRQYTLRSVPDPVDQALRRKARREGRSLNAVALEALAQGAGIVADAPYTDLDSFFGSWVQDAAVDEALAEQRRIDRKLWR